MFIKLIFTILLCISTNTTWARPNIKACWDRVSKDSTYYPMKIDKVTTIIGTMCREENGRAIYIYQNQLASDKAGASTQKEIDSLKVEVLPMACSDPNTLPLLKLIDMEYAYYDMKGKYIGRFTLQIEDCK